MNSTDRQLLVRVRSALQRRGVDVNKQSGMAICRKHVERLTGKPLSNTKAEASKQLNDFCSRGISDGLPIQPFTPLVGYQASIDRHRALCERTR